MNKYLYLILVITCCVSCKTIVVQQESQIVTSQSIMLGVIGEDKQFVLDQDYNHTAIPKYNTPIKIQVTTERFNNATYKAFAKANNSQSNKLKISLIDSLKEKPKFIKLEISDRVAVLNALNAKTNSDVKDYLMAKNNAHIVTVISIAVNEKDISALQAANEVFLEASGLKSYSLKAYIKGELKISLEFNEGVVFAYQVSNFCWQENNKSQLEIVDIVESSEKCPNKTYKSAKRAKKKIDYYDF